MPSRPHSSDIKHAMCMVYASEKVLVWIAKHGYTPSDPELEDLFLRHFNESTTKLGIQTLEKDDGT